MLAEALTVACSIEDSFSRVRALRELAPHLPVELLSEVRAEVLAEVLTAARSIEDSFSRVRALRELAPHLPVELPEVLTAARSIEG